MRLDLDISRDEQLRLEQQAAALGKGLAGFVASVLREQVDLGREVDHALPLEQWRARLQAFADRHKPTGHPLDDSRESIYRDRT
jgi:hypothetical protein